MADDDDGLSMDEQCNRTVVEELTLENMTAEGRHRFYDYLLAQHVHFEHDASLGLYVGRWRVRELPTPSHVLRLHANQTAERKARRYGQGSGTAGAGPGSSALVQKDRRYNETARQIRERYAALAGLVGSPDDLQARRHTVVWLLGQIEELYDARAAYDEHYELKRHEYTMLLQRKRHPRGAPAAERAAALDSFSIDLEPMLETAEFVAKYFANKFGLESLVRQHLWDLLYNVETLRGSFLEIEVFASFVEAAYTVDDLQFFLVTRRRLYARFRKPGQATETTALVMLDVARLPAVIESVVGPRRGKEFAASYMTLVDAYLSNRPADRRAQLELQEVANLALILHHQSSSGAASQQGGSAGNDLGALDASAGSSLRSALGASGTDPLQTSDARTLQERLAPLSTTAATAASGAATAASPSGLGSPTSAARRGSTSSQGLGRARRDSVSSAAGRSGLGGSGAIGSLSVGAAASAVASMLAAVPPSTTTLDVSDQLIACLRAVSLSYLDVVLGTASHLPRVAQEEIRRYAEDKLHDRVASVLSDVLQLANEHEPGHLDALEGDLQDAEARLTGSPQKLQSMCRLARVRLARSYVRMCSTRYPNADAAADAEVRFCQTLMATPDLRHDIEPTVAYLIAAAVEKASSEPTGPRRAPSSARVV